ncbi:MAG: hypothetical protein EOP10_30095 [Proteobacteria bacterium]|nr:MAG: hypothetical protein EOP10_30095 [Pseudomonadota bacterium]
MKKRLPDINVVPTRTTDVFQDPREKARIANENHGDLFLCIHADSGPLKTGRRRIGTKTVTRHKITYKGKGKRKKKISTPYRVEEPVYEYYKLPLTRNGTSVWIFAAHKTSDKLKAIPGVLGIRLEEEPTFKVLEEDGSIEVRSYEPTVIARTIVKGSRSEAMDEGFDRLAAYIFGENHSETKIDMTNPVFEGPSHRTPLTGTGKHSDDSSHSEYAIAFCLPKGMSIADVPDPNDERITVAEMPIRMMAVLRFSGTSSEENIQEAEAELKEWVRASLYEPLSEPIFAQYDQPFTVPFLRRNEVQIEIR